MKLRFASYFTALLSLVPASSLVAQTFSNPTSIQILDAGPADLYPSPIMVSGIGNTVIKITITLSDISHSFPDDIDILLVGPGGETAVVFSDCWGGPDPEIGADITLDDDAPLAMPDTGVLVTGTFQPTDFVPGDPFPAPAPPAGGVALSVFDGTDPNGEWRLFVVDDAGVDVGSIAGGWSITITAVPEPSTYAMVAVGAALLVGLQRFLRKKN